MASTSTVYIMRHCSRATYFPDMAYLPGEYKYLANYSDGGPIPNWGVPPAHCTARGRRIVAAQGKAMAAEIQARTLGQPLKIVYDGDAARDNTI